MDLRKFIFGQLPFYFKQNDSYKNAQGEGLLQRYLNTMGNELQEEIVQKLEGLINELDPETAANEYLSLLAFTVGSSIDITGDIETYRKQVAQSIALYKYKGTKRGYDLLFALLGYTVKLTTIIPPTYNYDRGFKFDDGVKYDLTKCNTHCLEYDLEYSNVIGLTDAGLTPEQEANIIKFITSDFEPINVKLRELKYVHNESNRVFSYQFNRNFS